MIFKRQERGHVAYTTERALWEITANGESVMAYMADPEGFLSRFALSADERSLILQKDVKALSSLGTSDMLVMLFWVATSGGFPTLGEYLGRMNAPN